MKIRRLENVKKTVVIPADKSISHRALILSAIAKGKTRIKPFLRSDDTQATLDCIKKLGAKVKTYRDGSLLVEGAGMNFLKKKKVILNARESGTTMRILSGLLCAQKFPIEFRASAGLKKRPMGRIVKPLREMGAQIKGKEKRSKKNTRFDVFAPLFIFPTKERLKAINYESPLPSAQVKSAIMLASLYADKETIIKEPYKSRDHTERMLKLFRVEVTVKGNEIKCKPNQELISPGTLFIPSDFSSAAFFIVLALISKNSEITVKGVNTNPTRCGLLGVLRRMGADIEIINESKSYEPYADIIARSSQLKATIVESKEIPSMIDEIPILCVAAARAKGQTNIQGVGELKVKETDRIKSIVSNLKRMGVDISAETHAGDWMISIKPTNKFKPISSPNLFDDHRTAMSLIIANTSAFTAMVNITPSFNDDDLLCIDKSFPEFINLYKSITKP